MALTLTDVQEITEVLQAIADRNSPGHIGGRLQINQADGSRLVVPFMRYQPPPRRRFVPDEDDGLTDRERDILESIAKHEEDSPDAEAMTGEKIAEKAGYEHTGRFRQILSDLITRGRIKRGPNGRGYVSTRP